MSTTAPISNKAWNFADAWESVARQLPDALAQQFNDDVYTWTDFNQRANGIAQSFLNAGVCLLYTSDAADE